MRQSVASGEYAVIAEEYQGNPRPSKAHAVESPFRVWIADRRFPAMTTTDSLTLNPVLRVAPATPAEAAAHFRASLVFHADVSDVAAALAADGDPGFVVLDSRSTEAWDQGHIPGAVHLPTALIPGQAGQLLDRAVPVVTYCWGPGCNGATRAALALAELGYQVKEMLGGFEYWVREGFEFETWEGRERRTADPLTAPAGSDDCGC
jgi:rhodanese-related sulfurtransferase